MKNISNNTDDHSMIQPFIEIDGLKLSRNGITQNLNPVYEFDKRSLDRVALAREFIRKIMVHSNKFDHNQGSYGLKHDCERAQNEYISNGEFIYAMHLEGYRIQHVWESSPNCLFNYDYREFVKRLKLYYPEMAKEYGYI